MSIVVYTRDKIIDRILAVPGISLTALAAEFGYSISWLSIVTNSDAFRERLEERRAELTDPVIVATLKDRLQAMAVDASELVIEKLHTVRDPNLAIKALEASAKWLAPRGGPQQVNVQQNFVAVVPEKRRNAADWLAAHSPIADAVTVAEAGAGGSDGSGC